MRSIQWKSLFVTVLVCAALFARGQVKTRFFVGAIPSNKLTLPNDGMRLYTIEAPDELAKAQREATSPEFSTRFAISKRVSIDFVKEAALRETRGGMTYTLTLRATNALNVSLSFSDFFIPEGGVFGIQTQREVTDSITAKENNPNRIWATRVYQGNTITLTLLLPASVKQAPSLKIDMVNFGFKQFGPEFYANVGGSAPCHVNVMCPDGNGWQSERNSVALIVVSGSYGCTGFLIMNTAGTNRPYFCSSQGVPSQQKTDRSPRMSPNGNSAVGCCSFHLDIKLHR